MSVHYKFKSALDYDTVTFDGLHISVGDLKAAISQQKRIGKTYDFDLQITNAQTKEVYSEDSTLIPKNTSLVIARVPLSQQPKKYWDGKNNDTQHKDVSVNKGLADLARMEGSEQDKINAMISQSTFDYDPSNYQKIRGQNQRGPVPPNYTCYKCHKRGHWIKDCPLSRPAGGGEPVEIRRSTGIPRSFMVPVEGPKAQGAMMTPSGTFAVPVVDREAYLASENAGGAEAASTAAVETAIPDELICSLCHDLLTDAVMIPCCGNSFCDECIRSALLDSEDHECPDCREKEISPTTLIPNRFLRTNVSLFRNETGYIRRVPHRPSLQPQLAPAGPVILQPTTAQSTNGVAKEITQNNESEVNDRDGTSSEGSGDDNITVTVPPAHAHRGHRIYHPHHRHPGRRIPHRYDHPPNAMLNSGLEGHQTSSAPVVDEQRASTPTVDERRDVAPPQMVFRNPPPFMPDVPPPHFNPAYPIRRGPPGAHERFRSELQPPPPGLKDSPNNIASVDPLEAFNRMIREKEARAKRREEERRRLHSPPPRSPSRSPPSRARSRSPPLILPPRARTPLSRGSSRLRYSRSRSKSRGRLRRSPWSPRRRRSRERSISFSRSPSPRRRHRSPLRYRSPMRSPPRDDRSPLRTPPRPRPPSRNLSPRRYPGVYADLMTSPLRSVEPQFLARYPRNNGPPANFPPMAPKTIPSLMSQHQEPAPVGFRGRYDGPPFEEVPPGIDPPIPGFEPSPFDKQPFPPNINDRDRLLPPPNYREPFRQFPENQVGYRDVGLPPGPNEIPIHVADQRYREGFRGAPPFRDQVNPPFREGQPPFREGQPPFREGQPPFRDGQPPFREGQPPFRDHAYRGPPPAGYRDNAFRNNNQIPFRDMPPSNYRDNPPNYRDGPGQYRRSREPPSVDHREPVGYDPNYRENFREIPQDDRKPREHSRERHKSSRHRDDSKRSSDYSRRGRENRDRNNSKDRNERGREGRDDRSRDERHRDRQDKDRERDVEKSSPDKRARESPKHAKRRSESRGRSRDRDSKRVRKEERTRDRSSTDRNRDHSHKDKDKKIKDKKKKKKEKDEKKKKREKREKDKKDKDVVKKEEGTADEKGGEAQKMSAEERAQEAAKGDNEDTECGKAKPDTEAIKETEEPQKVTNLYDNETSSNIDKNILDNYVQEPVCDSTQSDVVNKEELFDGIDLQIQPDELDLKDIESNDKEMLAPLPALSKWEVDDDVPEKFKEPGEISSPDDKEGHDRVTSEIIRRAEKAIFTKTSKPIEIKKISSDRIKLYADDGSVKDLQVTVADVENRSVHDKVKRRSKTPPPKLSIKDRLGGKIDDRKRDSCVLHSTVERVDSRSKTPKKEYPYRRVTLDRGPRLLGKIESNVQQRRLASEAVKASRNDADKRRNKDIKAVRDGRTPSSENVQNMDSAIKVPASRERKSTLDEANFEPDYDETLESEESEIKSEVKKRERSLSENRGAKKIKLDEGLKPDKKRTESSSDSSSDSDSSSSSSSSDRKRKKKHSKKKKRRRAASDSESDSGSSSDDHKKKKKKRKHKKKSSKKKKKSKHK